MTNRKRALRTGAVVLVSTALVAGGAVVWQKQQSAEPTAEAVFNDASPLTAGNLVKSHGVRVGSVQSVTLVHGKAEVTMVLDRSLLPLHTDAHATIRPVSLLGERYIDLDPGSDSAPFMSHAQVIPVSRTSESVDLDQVLNSLDDPTSTALAALVTTLGEGTQGNGKNVAAALRALTPAMTDAGSLVAVLNQQNALLNKLIDDAAPAARAAADGQGRTFDHLVESARTALATVAANRDAVDSALSELPTTLSKARRTLTALTGAAQATTPDLASITPVTDNLNAISAELHRFADAADPALTSLPPVLDRASALLDQAAPVVRSLRSGTSDLRLAAGSLTRFGLAVVDNLGGLIDFITGWAMCTSGYDSISHYFRGIADIDANTLKQLVPNLLPGVAALGGTPAPTSGSGSPQQSSQSGIPAPTASQPSTTDQAGGDNATGLTQQQEQSMLGQLLGGS